MNYYAHYQNKSARTNNRPTVVITSNMQGAYIPTETYLVFEVTGKREAREIAKNWDAKAWNF